MNSPYQHLPERAFWRSGVAARKPSDPGEVYVPRFAVTRDDKIMTAGSCFAQHVGRSLRDAKFNVLDVEPPPKRVDPTLASRFGFGMFTARYGNIYTTRQLMQLFEEAHGELAPADPVWSRDGRYFDAQRPNTEPEGLDSPETVMRLRQEHLAKVRDAFHRCNVFVFTFGLTEAWLHTESGTVYPTAPGTIAGTYDPAIHSFHNYRHHEVLSEFIKFRDRMREINPGIRFLITTSPVPLTATASGQHVEVATIYSKSVLRAVCGELYQEFDDVDYFPSYEIITSQRAGGAYYEANLRSVASHGVSMAMSTFMGAHGVAVKRPKVQVGRIADVALQAGGKDMDVVDMIPSMDRKTVREVLVTARSTLKMARELGARPDRAAGTARQDRPKNAEKRPAKKRLREMERKNKPRRRPDTIDLDQTAEEDAVCEDALLEAFSK